MPCRYVSDEAVFCSRNSDELSLQGFPTDRKVKTLSYEGVRCITHIAVARFPDLHLLDTDRMKCGCRKACKTRFARPCDFCTSRTNSTTAGPTPGLVTSTTTVTDSNSTTGARRPPTGSGVVVGVSVPLTLLLLCLLVFLLVLYRKKIRIVLVARFPFCFCRKERGGSRTLLTVVSLLNFIFYF